MLQINLETKIQIFEVGILIMYKVHGILMMIL